MHRVVIFGTGIKPTIVHGGDKLNPLAAFVYRADAIRFAKLETRPRIVAKDLPPETGWPCLAIEGPGIQEVVVNGEFCRDQARIKYMGINPRELGG